MDRNADWKIPATLTTYDMAISSPVGWREYTLPGIAISENEQAVMGTVLIVKLTPGD